MKVTKNALLFGLEALLLCVMLVFALRPKTTLMNVDASSGLIYVEQQNEVGIESEAGIRVLCMDLPELAVGTYELLVSYEVTEKTAHEMEAVNYLQLRGGEDYFRSVLYNPAEFVAGDNQMRMSFCLRDNAADLEAYVEGATVQTLTITGMELVRTSGAARMALCLLLLILTPLNLLYALYRYMGTHTLSMEQVLVWIGVPIVALIASIPLFTDYLLTSAETEQILRSIDAMAQGREWNGVGLLIGLPVMFRKLGFTLNLAYAISVLLLNMCAALATYGIFNFCFGRQVVAWLGCMFYTMAPWRLEGIYVAPCAEMWKILVGAAIALTLCWLSSRMLRCENKVHRNIFFTMLCGGYLLVALSCINNMMLWTEGLTRMY